MSDKARESSRIAQAMCAAVSLLLEQQYFGMLDCLLERVVLVLRLCSHKVDVYAFATFVGPICFEQGGPRFDNAVCQI